MGHKCSVVNELIDSDSNSMTQGPDWKKGWEWKSCGSVVCIWQARHKHSVRYLSHVITSEIYCVPNV